MTRNRRMMVVTTTLLVVALVASSCELSLNNVDCSGIDQPDMGRDDEGSAGLQGGAFPG